MSTVTRVVYHRVDGTSDSVEVTEGTNLMVAAITNSVHGIVGECGGQAMCATCHVYVRESFVDLLPPMGEDEDEMLDCTASERDPARSRLGCQLAVEPGWREIEVDLPETQA